MIQNHYIQAAIQLKLIQSSENIGQDEDHNIILPDKTKITITEEIKNKAKNIEVLITVRIIRNQLLSETDWVALSDVPESDMKTKLLQYRKQLRDLPDNLSQVTDIGQVVFAKDPRYE